MDGTATAAHSRIALGKIFQPFEHWQQIFIAPTSATQLVAPGIVFSRITTHKQITVDRTASADHPAARPLALLPVQPALRCRQIRPDPAWVIQYLRHECRNMQLVVIVTATGLEQQHAMAAVSRQAIGNSTTGRTGTDNDIIKSRIVRNIRNVHWASPNTNNVYQTNVGTQNPAGAPAIFLRRSIDSFMLRPRNAG